MTDHLSITALNALADGELSQEELNVTNQHLAQCSSCASHALNQSLLKSGIAKAGDRYTPPPGFEQRLLTQLRQQETSQSRVREGIVPTVRSASRFYVWAGACAVLIVCAGLALLRTGTSPGVLISPEQHALVTEASDQHLAAIASMLPPQVLSSDRHTVKPWFQGKIPFSFNLPENLPAGTTLDGANLTYIHRRPAAQLLYSIGKHRVSVYLEQRAPSEPVGNLTTDQSGFHVILFATSEMSGVAVSDVEPSHLSDLVSRIAQAQKK